MPRSLPLTTLLAAVVLALSLVLPWLGEAYLTHLTTGILILGLAATSLNILVGYGGMVSFGHAVFLGIGAYAIGILGLCGLHSGFLGLPAAVLAAALAAAVIGGLSLRASGVFFIMITLAFAQMLYYAVIAIAVIGGDDGLHINPTDFAGIVSLKNPFSLYYLSLFCLLAAIYLCHRLTQSHFGRALRGIKDNERRMISLGFPAYRYKLTAFVIAGALAGLAGALYANLDAYASPELVQWTMSGDLLVMLILGGVGTLVGPVLGAAAFKFLQDVISNYTQHWMLVFGPLLLVIVLVSHRGILGLLLPVRSGRG